jgi:pyroglutamyl-peptidase
VPRRRFALCYWSGASIRRIGVAQTEPVLRLERVARRHAGELAPDVEGRLPETTDVSPGALAEYLTPLDLPPLAASLSAAGISCRLSDDAGRYLCNHTYYVALHTIAAADLPTRCFFLHVPADEETTGGPGDQPIMLLDRQIEAVAHLLALLR